MSVNSKLSLCIIVKDEERWIARCLTSVKDVVDEMIVVDTGSSDRTREIAKALGASVYPYAWSGHFADARNFGVEKATGEWILWLDADEEVDVKDAPHLRDVLALSDQSIALIELINFHGTSPPHSNNAYRLAHHRLFRNGIGLRFRNSIHEQLNVGDIIPNLSAIPSLPMKVYHYGYMDTVTEDKKKFERNHSLLLKAAEASDPDPWVYYHLASEAYRIQEYKLSFEQVNKSIIHFLQKGLTPPSMLYKLKYASLLSLGSFDGAWPAIDKAIAMYPDYVDLHFYKGVILMQKDRLEEALASFRYCLELGEGNLNHLTLKGLGSFQPWYYIGLCQEKKGNPEEAREAYEEALKLSPEHPEAREAYSHLLSG